MIYENDMPITGTILPFPNKEKKYCAVSDNCVMPPESAIGYDRWKPNGITDNRDEWRKKMAIKKFIDVSAKYWEGVDDPAEWVRSLR